MGVVVLKLISIEPPHFAKLLAGEGFTAIKAPARRKIDNKAYNRNKAAEQRTG